MLHLTVTPPTADLALLEGLPHLAEVLLEHQRLARTGSFDDQTLLAAIAECRRLNLRAVLVWDVLTNETGLLEGAAFLRSLPLADLAAVRVQDVGVAHYLQQAFPELPRQLVLETGNHNLAGICAWVRALNPERVVLSNELPIDLIRKIVAAVDVAVELAALGRLLIFYSPRKLVQAAEGETFEAVRRRFAIEKETGKTFPIVENRHGTLMYYEKDLSLLPWFDVLAGSGVGWARLDFKFFDPALVPAVRDWLIEPSPLLLEILKGFLSTRQTRGFFKSNRTDKQFQKLTNPNLMVREGTALLGTVLESARKEGYTALELEAPIEVGEVLTYVIPEGETLTHEVAWIRDSSGLKHERADKAGLWLIDHVKKASSGTRFYRDLS